MRISVGMLAYNEEASIGPAIESVLRQTLLSRPGPELTRAEFICVANGCSDDTARVARETLAFIQSRGLDERIRVDVEELEQGGKTHAWNQFVHRIADQEADFIIMMDGDIRVEHPNTIRNLVSTLVERPKANLAAPRAIKHIELKERRSLLEQISLRLGSLNRARPYGLAGCMYCARGEVLRRIWFPPGMIGEDAFLNGMIVTDLCRSKEVYDRVVGAPDATVVFEAYTTVRKMYRVLRRQAITRGMNAILWDYLWRNTGDLDAGALIKKRTFEDPDWYRKLIVEHVAGRGWWVMPSGVIFRRWGYLRQLPWLRQIVMFPWAIIGVAVDAIVNLDANARLRAGQIEGHWETTKTTKI